MIVHLRRSITFALICMVFFGFVYAFAGTGVAQLLFKFQANGSLTANGSTLIGQNWTSPKFFHGRPDDSGPYAANAKTHTSGGDNPLLANGVSGQSGATNLGPRSRVLLADTKALVAYWHSMGVNPTPDLVTTSGSGYDPDISPQDALVQIPMVAKATGLSASSLTSLIKSQTHGPQFGFLGASYIDVLQLNEALAKMR
ncbi:MAG: potassium-transporting ATPase subunit C [Acidimicrobiaceae bacterium]|nr:potassium-transporting ATPase subunit C [Acidimicrobiaceae bacterium]